MNKIQKHLKRLNDANSRQIIEMKNNKKDRPPIIIAGQKPEVLGATASFTESPIKP